MAFQTSALAYQLLFLQLLLFFSQTTATHCSHDQTSVLLQFKQHFSFINLSSYFDCEAFAKYSETFGNESPPYCDGRCPSSPKTLSWKEDLDCCSWPGVTCDTATGHVIGLDLSCGWLHGKIPSNSTLFLLRHLQRLNLAFNDFSLSHISSDFSQLSGLTHLNLSNSNFTGKIPSEISHLSKLVSLDLSTSDYVSIYSFASEYPFQVNFSKIIIEKAVFQSLVQNLTKLTELFLDTVDMSTVIPCSLSNLSSSLTLLSLSDCGLRGNFPDQIFRFPNLQFLSVGGNFNLTGNFPSVNWSSPLKDLDASDMSLSGKLPNSTGNLISLRYLLLRNCSLVGSIPTSLGNLTQLFLLALDTNNFHGRIPSFLSNFVQLSYLDLTNNNFIGEFPDIFCNLTQLSHLYVSNNQLSGSIPSQIGSLQNLIVICLDHNSLNGILPSWLFNQPLLRAMVLSDNQLTGHIDEFKSNLLQLIFLGNNKLTGEIPHSICNMSVIEIIDLSYNSLSGKVPECIGNLSSLHVLDLRKNRFYGTIPRTFTKGNYLRTFNLNDNELEGPVPRSLVNCSKLEVLDVGHNKINDTFPYWLGRLPKLQILVLCSNKFYGSIQDCSETNYCFHKLRIFDLSSNKFSGFLPARYFEELNAMMNIDEVERKLEYMGETYYKDSITVTMKGCVIELVKIIITFTTIDFSNNNFHGGILEVIGKLTSLRLLNLSQNNLTGYIPSSLGNLRALESLDLSSNKLVGRIPWQLTRLNFLQVLNLSQNQLVGPIPRDSHFDTFTNDSYDGNLDLCGFPLSNVCVSIDAPQPSSTLEDDGESSNGFGWKVVLIGYGCGMVFGVFIGYLMFSTGKPQWLVLIVEGERPRKGRRPNNKHWGRRR